jgi:hypothetical protein
MSDESTPRAMLKGGPLVDHPGWWMVEAWKENNPADTRNFVRKEDGTYWDVAVIDLFPRSGGTLKVTLGEEITDAKRLSTCRDFYAQLKKKADEDAEKAVTK